MPYAEDRKNVDKPSALHSFDGPLQLIHANIADICYGVITFVSLCSSLFDNCIKLLEATNYNTSLKVGC